MSVEEWFKQKEFIFSKYITLPFISTGLCGMDYDRVPAAYMVKLQKFIFRLPLWRQTLLVSSRVTLGNNEIWRRAGKELDIRYNSTIKRIRMDQGKISINMTDQTVRSF